MDTVQKQPTLEDVVGFRLAESARALDGDAILKCARLVGRAMVHSRNAQQDRELVAVDEEVGRLIEAHNEKLREKRKAKAEAQAALRALCSKSAA